MFCADNMTRSSAMAYLEGKVEGLCGEVPDDVSQVTSPE